MVFKASDCRSLNRVIQLFKITNNLTPAYLQQKLPPLRIENPNLIEEMRARTRRYKNTFYSNAISSWNNIIVNIQGNITKSTIKSRVLKIIRPNSNSFYDIHDPIGLHILFQLRTGLSPLRSHKFRHNFQDTPSDICACTRGIEDTKHFFSNAWILPSIEWGWQLTLRTSSELTTS